MLGGFAALAGTDGAHAASAPDQAAGTIEKDGHIKLGQKMPAISVEETSGEKFSIAAAKGKVIVVNFWATWCGPCQLEMPRLEKEIWQKYRSAEFAMVAIGREETKETVTAFQAKHREYTFPMAYDPRRASYALFADSGIPRTYVVDRKGNIVYQSLGYDPQDIPALDQAIQKALAGK
jgi:thiol-disulfide isomerase/thioredoxin